MIDENNKCPNKRISCELYHLLREEKYEAVDREDSIHKDIIWVREIEDPYVIDIVRYHTRKWVDAMVNFGKAIARRLERRGIVLDVNTRIRPNFSGYTVVMDVKVLGLRSDLLIRAAYKLKDRSIFRRIMALEARLREAERLGGGEASERGAGGYNPVEYLAEAGGEGEGYEPVGGGAGDSVPGPRGEEGRGGAVGEEAGEAAEDSNISPRESREERRGAEYIIYID